MFSCSSNIPNRGLVAGSSLTSCPGRRKYRNYIKLFWHKSTTESLHNSLPATNGIQASIGNFENCYTKMWSNFLSKYWLKAILLSKNRVYVKKRKTSNSHFTSYGSSSLHMIGDYVCWLNRRENNVLMLIF